MYYALCLYVYLYAQVGVYQGTCGESQENSLELSLSCHLVGPREATHSVRPVNSTSPAELYRMLHKDFRLQKQQALAQDELGSPSN